jgi:hypothetical protein
MMRRWLAWTMLATWWACAQPDEARAAGTDYCAQSERSVLFLIDRTTAYDDQDQEVLVDGLERFFKELETGDRLLLYTIGASAADSRRLFDACVPGCPEEGFLGSLLGSCRAVVARADRQQFTRQLLATLIDLLNKHVDYEASAILETVRAVADTNRATHPARLVIFSDMLENTDLLTFGQLTREGADAALKRVEAQGMVPDLDGIEVDAFGIGRSHVPGRPPLQLSTQRVLETFWEELFRKAGAAQVAIGPEYAPGSR